MKTTGPPRIASWILERFTSGEGKQTIRGDLEEYFHEVVSESGRRSAARMYWSQALAAAGSLALGVISWKISMARSYFILALRNLRKERTYSLINISGLAIGLACSFLIATWVLDEASFDRHFSGSSDIYRINFLYGAEEEANVWTPVQFADALEEDLAPVEGATLVLPLRRKLTVRTGEKAFLEDRTLISDEGFFEIFDTSFLRGSPLNALVKPNSLVLSESTARRYFGSADPLGKTVEIGSSRSEYEVTAVIEDCRANSHLQYDMIFNNDWEGYGWGSNSVFTYVRLAGGTSPESVEKLFPKFIEKNYSGPIRASFGISLAEFMENPEKRFRLSLQPLRSIHLSPGQSDNVSLRGDLSHVYIFSLVSLLILIVAGVNFVNLSTARAGRRAREVGVRKVAGADRKMLVGQFLFESVLSSIFSAVLAAVLILAVLPRFNELTGKVMKLGELFTPANTGGLIAAGLLCGILAGIYPALRMASFRPADAVKAGAGPGIFGSGLRDVLVVFQYTVTTVIFLGAFVIYNQSDYLTSARLGFDKERVLVVHRARSTGEGLGSFMRELENIPGIEAVTNTSSMPGKHFNPNGHRLEGAAESDEKTLFTMYSDSGFCEVFGVAVSRGRFFDENIDTDRRSSVVINESAVRKLGLVDPIGKRFRKEFGGAGKGEFVTIVGVLEDFHFHSLHSGIEPMIIRNLGDSPGYYISARMESGRDPVAIVDQVRDTWSRFADESLFEYSFLDDDFDALYKSEIRTGRIMSTFFVLSVLIACLGLYGLVSFSVEQRTKEIGIRKVLGASLGDILILLSRRITVLVAIANLIAWPVAYLLMTHWLDRFAYRTDLHLWLPLLSTAVGLGLALLTVSHRAITAARANPVENIRYE